jgi:hypothetical protein
VKLLEPAEEPGSIAGFLGKAVEPPVGPAVDHAITLLQVRLNHSITTVATTGWWAKVRTLLDTLVMVSNAHRVSSHIP